MQDLIDSTLYNGLSEREKALCSDEAKVLASCRMTECFFVLAEAVRRLDREGIAHMINGSVNTSYLAYVSGIIPYKPVMRDYIFERFINPERESAMPPKITIVIDVADSKMLATRKYLMIAHKPYEEMVELLLTGTGTSTLLASRYSKIKAAKSSGMSVLEVSVNLRPEITGYVELLSRADSAVTVTDAELYDYINTTPIESVFGKAAGEYFGVIKQLEPRDLDALALCMGVACQSDREATVRVLKAGGARGYRDEIHELLTDSRGVFFYQEQMIKALSVLSGCSYRFADGARRAMAIRSKSDIDTYKLAFLYGIDSWNGQSIDGCAKRDTLVAGRNLWAELEQITPGLYCKANAVRRARFYLDCARLSIQEKK